MQGRLVRDPRDAAFANLAHRLVVDQSAVATTGLKHLLSLGGVYAQSRASRATRRPLFHPARGLLAAIDAEGVRLTV